jgi:lipoate-protein ligase A
VVSTVERVDGAWCPGFSDLAVGGRKLAGLGFRVTRERVVMRGVMAVRAMDDADFGVLVSCHRLIGVELRHDAAVSLAEASETRDLTVAATIDSFRTVVS